MKKVIGFIFICFFTLESSQSEENRSKVKTWNDYFLYCISIQQAYIDIDNKKASQELYPQGDIQEWGDWKESQDEERELLLQEKYYSEWDEKLNKEKLQQELEEKERMENYKELINMSDSLLNPMWNYDKELKEETDLEDEYWEYIPDFKLGSGVCRKGEVKKTLRQSKYSSKHKLRKEKKKGKRTKVINEYEPESCLKKRDKEQRKGKKTKTVNKYQSESFFKKEEAFDIIKNKKDRGIEKRDNEAIIEQLKREFNLNFLLNGYLTFEEDWNNHIKFQSYLCEPYEETNEKDLNNHIKKLEQSFVFDNMIENFEYDEHEASIVNFLLSTEEERRRIREERIKKLLKKVKR